MTPRFLLLQARHPDDPARGEEVASFALRLGVSTAEVATHDLLGGPPTLAAVRRQAALLIGGSGEHYVSKRNLPHYEAFFALLREVVEVGHPTFASCFGFQCMVEALGGDIVHDAENIEVGTYELSLTVEGRSDELLGALPERFFAQMGRKDRAARLPDGVPGLASSERCPFQALRIPGKPIWAFQFHPELDAADNRRRFLQYLDGYAPHLSGADRERALRAFRDSSREVHELLPRFVALIGSD